MADDKKIIPIDVEIDEIGLSVLGWEISNFQARLVKEDFSDGKWVDVYYEVAASMELHFHPDDWHVRHDDGDYLPPLLWQVRSRSQGPLMGYARMGSYYKKKQLKAPKTISAKIDSWQGGKGAPQDLYLWVGAVDWEDVSDSSPSFNRRQFPVEVVDYSTARGIGTHLNECIATRNKSEFNEGLEVTVRGLHPLGTAEELFKAAVESDDFYGDPDEPIAEQDAFEVEAPTVSIQIFDDTGFLLTSSEGIGGNHVTIAKGGDVPVRPPSFVTNATFDLDDLAGKPARVVVRIQDPEE